MEHPGLFAIRHLRSLRATRLKPLYGLIILIASTILFLTAPADYVALSLISAFAILVSAAFGLFFVEEQKPVNKKPRPKYKEKLDKIEEVRKEKIENKENIDVEEINKYINNIKKSFAE